MRWFLNSVFLGLIIILGWLWRADTGHAESIPLASWEGRTMGTCYSVKLAGVEPADRRLAGLRAAVDQRLDDINHRMSHYLNDSELSRFNAGTSTAPVRVSAELARVTRYALALHQQSGGAFDPTLGRLIDLWGFGAAGRREDAPTEEQILACRRQSGARHVRVTPQDELQKDLPGLQINLGAVGKGYGADEAARVLHEHGFTNVLVAVGGEMVASGVNSEGQPWQVGVELPRYGVIRGTELGAVVPLSGRALSTSGDAHNFFQDKRGRIYAHILDPATSRPVQHNLASVTVVAANGLMADGLATAVYVMGFERGLRWVEQQHDIAALFIIRENADRCRLVASLRFPPFRRMK